jgi:hypothetical protein
VGLLDEILREIQDAMEGRQRPAPRPASSPPADPDAAETPGVPVPPPRAPRPAPAAAAAPPPPRPAPPPPAPVRPAATTTPPGLHRLRLLARQQSTMREVIALRELLDRPLALRRRR